MSAGAWKSSSSTDENRYSVPPSGDSADALLLDSGGLRERVDDRRAENTLDGVHDLEPETATVVSSQRPT